MLILEVNKRSKTDNVEHMRNNGMVPGVVYGAFIENTSISCPQSVFEKLYKEVGHTSPVELSLEGKNIQVLIHEVQFHPVKGFPMHIDFLTVDKDTKAEVAVPLEFIGVAPAQKGGLGNIVKVLHEIEIKALPKDIPQQIDVDLSKLENLDSQIVAGDLLLPNGVELVTKKDEIIASVATMKEEKENTVVDLGSIEVAKKGKKEEAE
jgi:large subunit ribosomal protein L25